MIPRLSHLLRRSKEGGVPALFAERRVAWCYLTRVGIRAACDVLALPPGAEILVPSYHCGSEIDPLRDAGLSPAFYDTAPDLVVRPGVLARRITTATKAIYLIHYFGVQQPQTDEIRALCDRHGLKLIEDCSLSLLSGPEPAQGKAGHVSLFCVHKFFPALAGGAIVINDPALALPRLSQHLPPARLYLRKASGQALRMLSGGRRHRNPSGPPAEEISSPEMPNNY